MSRRDTALRYFDENRTAFAKEVAAGIEQYRKTDACLLLEGTLADDATVEIRQINHAFRFGANLFMLDELETPEKNAAYKEKFARLFNLATVPFYWNDLEPEKGRPRYAKHSPRIYRRPAPDLCVDYCREHGIEPKCHCLNYDPYTPAWLQGASAEEIKAQLTRRFAEIAARYTDSIPSFEVTNETLSIHPTNPQSVFFSADDFVEWSFQTADRYFPHSRLIINEYNIWDSHLFNRTAYHLQIERLLQRKAGHLDSVGLQFHSFFPQAEESRMAKERYNPVILKQMLNGYASFGLKEQITEMTIPAYSDRPEDEYVQAELLKNVYSLFFSHPAIEAIIYWNLVDGYAAYAPQGDMTAGENAYFGGLLRYDMSEKPAYRMLCRLINEEWHTELTEKPRQGRIPFRGFYGDYEATVITKDSRKTVHFSLTEGENRIRIQV